MRTWDGGCGAGEPNWSCAANWSENTVPGEADTALFNATSSNDSSVDAGFIAGKVANLRIASGYGGTLSLARSLTVTTAFTQATGTFSAGAQALTLKTLTISGGSFTASSGTTSIASTLKISGTPTFNANGGSVNFNGGGGTLTCGGVAFNAVTIANVSGTKTVGSGCDLPLGASPIVGSGGSLSLNGTLSGTGVLTEAKKLTLGMAGELSGFEGLHTGPLTVNGSYDFGEYGTFDVDGNFIVGASGNFTAPAGVASFARSLTINSASTFDANEGTIAFDGTTSFTMSCGGKTLSLVTFSTGHKTIDGNCTLPLGANPDLGTGGTRLKGTLSGSGTLTQSGTFEIESSAPGLSAFSDVLDVGSLLLKTGTVFTAPSGELTVQGNFTVSPSGVTFNAGTGIVNFAGSGKATKYLTCSGVAFNLVKLTNTGKQVVSSGCTLPLGENPTIGEGGPIVVNGVLEGSGALATDTSPLTLGTTGSLGGFSGLEAGGNLTIGGSDNFGAYSLFEVGGDFILGEGASFTAPASTASFAGDFVDNGTFVANEGTVALTGSGQQLDGSTTFYNLEKVVGVEDTLTFEAAAKQTIVGTLTLEGAEAGKLLNLVSSEPGTQWLIEAEGTDNVKLVGVEDGKALGTPIPAEESFDAGGNEGWEFL